MARRTSAGVVVAGITLHADALAFPAKGWTDFAEELSRVSAATWRAALVEDRLTRDTRSIHELSASELVEDLVSESERLLSLCSERTWWSADSARLQAAVRTLRARPRLLE